MAKKIEETKKPVKKKGTTHIDINKDISKQERQQIIDMTSEITKVALHHQKVLAVFVTFDVKGVWHVVHFGAAPEIKKRAIFLADKVSDMIPAIMESYEIPQMDVSTKKVDA